MFRFMNPRIQRRLLCLAVAFFSGCNVVPIDDSGTPNKFSLEQVARSRVEVRGKDLMVHQATLAGRGLLSLLRGHQCPDWMQA